MAARGHLKSVESPQEMPIIPVRPLHRLRGEPGEHLLGVAELLLEVFVGQHPLRVAAAAQDPDPGVSVSSQVGVVDRVPDRGEVTLAVRDELQDGGDGPRVGGLRPPDASGKPVPSASGI